MSSPLPPRMPGIPQKEALRNTPHLYESLKTIELWMQQATSYQQAVETRLAAIVTAATSASLSGDVIGPVGSNVVGSVGGVSADDVALAVEASRRGIPIFPVEDGEDGLTIPGRDGAPGAAGAIGAGGPAGVGVPGFDGEEGADGIPGVPGVAGAAGAPGTAGATGAPGIGIPGPDGEDGVDGMPGPAGVAGAAGVSGAIGATGATGLGVSGFDGEDGADSLVPGPIGPTGASGQMGPPPFDGEDGADGIPIIGPQGFQGFAGPSGMDGADGEDSYMPGIPGPQGVDGTPPGGVQAVDASPILDYVFTRLDFLEEMLKVKYGKNDILVPDQLKVLPVGIRGPVGPAGPPGPLGGTGPAGVGAGALVLLEQYTAASSATIDFTTGISATYDDYIVEMVNITPANDNTVFQLQVGTGGGPTYDVTSGHYLYTTWQTDTLGGSGSRAAGAATFIELANGLSNSSSAGGLSGRLTLHNPGSATQHKNVFWESFRTNTGSSTFLQNHGGGKYTQTTAVTAIRFKFDSGNIASGIFRMYGIAKS